LNGISQFVVRTCDLIEAEGSVLLAVVRGEARRAHRAAMSSAMGVAVLLIAVPIAVGGVWLLSSGLMMWLESEFSRPVAACLTGVALLAVAGGCFVSFRKIVSKDRA